MHIPQLSPAELQRWRQDGKAFLLLDVRTDEETAVCALPDSVHIPMNRNVSGRHRLRNTL